MLDHCRGRQRECGSDHKYMNPLAAYALMGPPHLARYCHQSASGLPASLCHGWLATAAGTASDHKPSRRTSTFAARPFKKDVSHSPGSTSPYQGGAPVQVQHNLARQIQLVQSLNSFSSFTCACLVISEICKVFHENPCNLSDS